MDTRLLRFFIAVYEQKNLTRAAEQCFVSQPNISNGIKQLEEEIGKQLFIRHKRGVIINTEAHYLYPIAKRLLGEITSLSDIFKEREFTDKITIGVAESLPQEHKQQFFRTATHLSDSLQWDVRPIGRDCEINLLVREWKYEEDLFLPLWKENYVLCIPDGHHLLSKDVIELEDLQHESFIHCPPCEAHKQCLSILSNTSKKSVTIANCATKTETLTFLMAGLGVTFLPEHFIDGWYGFQVKPYNGPRYFREVGLSYPRKSLKNPAISKLIDYFSKNTLRTKKFSEFGYYTK
ncbi:LysR family transcriptional regulator [Aquimarina hainanensis]|uniref:LysR family transcriptional regulator n=1 Tax=Aquimarina hainanensis TaxID=1578017 RepID=A0ABW5N522_9FLAO|nr:LysR family transcriptional regulator [Aquimarina sp. TRL1]QKX04666.1 LysR family transcriptional regulator [Aquimarina sp. TRL1]